MKPSTLLLTFLVHTSIANGAITTVIAITSTMVITLSTTLVLDADITSLPDIGPTSPVLSGSTSDTISESTPIAVPDSTLPSGPDSTSEVTSDLAPVTTPISTSMSMTTLVSTSTTATTPDTATETTPDTATATITDTATEPTTDVPAESTSEAAVSSSPSDLPSSTTSAEASPTALAPGLRLQIVGSAFDGYFVGNDDPAGGFGVASLYIDPAQGDVFTSDTNERLIATDGASPNYANQDAGVPAQPIYFNSAASLASFMDPTYLNCLFSGDTMTCTSGDRDTFAACDPGVYNTETPTLYLNMADRVDDGCTAVTIRVVTF